MDRSTLEVADIFRRYGDAYRDAAGPSLAPAQRRVMTAIESCRTAVLGGHGSYRRAASPPETLQHPNSIGAGASGRRLRAAADAGALEPAIDAAVSARAANSIEKKVCHQLAAVHLLGRRLLERSVDDVFSLAKWRVSRTRRHGCSRFTRMAL